MTPHDATATRRRRRSLVREAVREIFHIRDREGSRSESDQKPPGLGHHKSKTEIAVASSSAPAPTSTRDAEAGMSGGTINMAHRPLLTEPAAISSLAVTSKGAAAKLSAQLWDRAYNDLKREKNRRWLTRMRRYFLDSWKTVAPAQACTRPSQTLSPKPTLRREGVR